MTRRSQSLCIGVVLVLSLVVLPERALAAATVTVSAWNCPATVDPTTTDSTTFATECTQELTSATFALTAQDITRRRAFTPGKRAIWPAVSGPFTLTLEEPANQPAIVFCDQGDGTPVQIDVSTAAIKGDLSGNTGWTCQWYLVPLSASPVAASPQATASVTPSPTPPDEPTTSPTPQPTATMMATSTTAPSATPRPTSTPQPTPTTAPTSTPPATATAAPTSTPMPTATTAPSATPIPTSTLMPTSTPMPTPTNTLTPTVTNTPPATSTATAVATATATERPDPRATATAIASVIAEVEATYLLPFHTLSYKRGTDLKVYPDPGDDDAGFEVEDFVLDVTFLNRPTDDRPWNYGVLFGPTEDDASYRIVLQSDGTWYFALGDKTVRDGEARGAHLEDGDANTFRVIVSGGRGIFFLNDRFIASFDLSSREPSGKLWLATSTIDGSDIAFSDLSIWLIPSS